MFCNIIIFRCLFVFPMRERKKGCGLGRVGSWGRKKVGGLGERETIVR